MGFVFMLRLQMAFAFLGLALWLLFYSKWHFRDWFIISFFGIVAIGLCVVVDHWFYGTWVLTPYNYYKVNIIQHAAAKFGVYPWWYYFSLFIQYAAPPLSIVLLPLFFIGIWKKPLHLFTWVCVVFIAGHSLIGHKEMRFLLPVTISFIFLSCSGLDWLFSRYPDTWVFRWPVKLFAVINSFVLVAKILTPSHESIPYYKFIYEYSQKQPTTLVSFEESPYQHVDLHTNFYKPGNLHEIVIHNPEELTNILKNANGQSVIFLNPEIDPIPVIALFKKEKLFCLLPDWVRLLNFNDWESRSYIWTIYRLN